MPNTILHKRNSTPGAVPTATGLSQGELGINISDGKLYTKNSSNNIINLGTTSISGTYITPSSGNFSNYLAVNGVPVSVSGHSHTSIQQAESLVTTVFNETGSQLSKMTAVYINGGHGDLPTVQKAIATSDATSAGTYGLTYTAINNMESGQVIVFGSLSGLNTDPAHGGIAGATEGSVLYLSPTVSGALTTTKPYAPNHVVTIGTVVRVHQNEGVVEVRIQNGFELDELHNVAITGATNGQFLQYNSGSGLWIPSSSGNFSSLSVNNTGVSLNGHNHNGVYADIATGDPTLPGNSIVDRAYALYDPVNDWPGLWVSDTSVYSSDPAVFDSFKINMGLTEAVIGTGIVNHIPYWNSVNGIVADSGQLVWDSTNNRLGIGTTTPSGTLDVRGSLYFGSTGIANNLYLRTGQAGISETALKLRTDTTSNLYLDATNAYVKVGNQSADVDIAAGNAGIRIGNNSAQTLANQNIRFVPANTEVMRITPTGVGIGTTSPSSQLHVIGSGIFTSGLFINSTPVSVSGHTHTSSDITNFNSSVSGLLPTISNSGDNRIITSDGTTTGLNAENNFTFNGSLLNVTGSGSFSNNVIASGFIRTGGTSSQFLKADGSVDSTSYQSSLTNPVTGTGIASHIAYWNSSSGITADSGQLYWDATNNRLGINTSSPAASLDIRGSAVFNENGADADFRIEGDTDTHLLFLDASTDRIGIGYNAPTTKLQVNGSFSCGGGGGGDPSSGGQGLYVDPVTPLLRFNDSGPNYVADIDINGLTLYDIASNPFFYTDRANSRIGIGIAFPSETLDVNGVFKSLGFKSYGTSWFGASDGSVGIAANTNPSGTFGANSAFAAFQGFNDAVSSYNPICFTTLYEAQLYLNTNGNVGIGTATPSYKLDVNGTIGDSTNGYVVVQDLTISNSTAGTIGIDAATNNLSIGGDGTIIIASVVDQQVNINSNVDVNGDLTFNSYTEKVVSIGNSSTSKTISLASGTVQTCTLTGNCTFTMPATTAGKSFTMFLNTGSGNYTASFSGVRWADSAMPTATILANKVDIYSFISDGSYWYGSFSQNYG